MSEKTRAERRAEAYAEVARGYQLEAEVRVSHEPADLFSSGEVMLPARTFAHLTVREPTGLGDHLTAGWVTWEGVPGGRRSSTRYLHGELSQVFSPNRKLATEREFANRLHVYSYRAHREEAS